MKGKEGVMMRKMRRSCLPALILLMLLLVPLRVAAETTPVYKNAESGYEVYLLDEEDLLDDAEEAALTERMKGVTSFGHAAFVSAKSLESRKVGESKNEYEFNIDPGEYAEQRYRELFDREDGTLFLIDMRSRTIQIFSDGRIYRIITSGKALSITDNVYSHASRGDYFTCADEAFSQIITLLEGGRISEPMKYLSNAFLALILAAIINYFIVRVSTARFKPNNRELINAMEISYEQKNASVTKQGSHRKYSPSAAIITARVALALLKASAGASRGSSRGGRSSGGGGGHRF